MIEGGSLSSSVAMEALNASIPGSAEAALDAQKRELASFRSMMPEGAGFDNDNLLR